MFFLNSINILPLILIQFIYFWVELHIFKKEKENRFFLVESRANLSNSQKIETSSDTYRSPATEVISSSVAGEASPPPAWRRERMEAPRGGRRRRPDFWRRSARWCPLVYQVIFALQSLALMLFPVDAALFSGVVITILFCCFCFVEFCWLECLIRFWSFGTAGALNGEYRKQVEFWFWILVFCFCIQRRCLCLGVFVV